MDPRRDRAHPRGILPVNPISPVPLSHTTPAGLATAARIAAALGRPARSIRRALDGIDPDGSLVVNGNATAAWLFSSLPVSIRNGLIAEAARRGYQSEEHLLQAPPDCWMPPVPLSELDEATIQNAGNLQRALTPTLQRLQDTRMTSAEIASLGLSDYRRVFGHEIGKRHFDRLTKRTLDRDCGAENWARLEIFLPDRCAAKKAATVAPKFDDVWQPMLTLVSAFPNKLEPTPKAVCMFWDQAFACCELLIDSGTPAKRARRELRHLIEASVPFIASRGRALETKIRRAFDRWIDGGRNATAIADRRAQESGRTKAAELPQPFLEKLVARTHANGGRVAQSWREAITEGWMPAEVSAAYPFNWEFKSRVPRAIRMALDPYLTTIEPQRTGSHNARMKGPCINRDYSGVPSGKIFQSDDVTLPVWFYVLNDDGTFTMTRGQFLPWICARTQYIVTFQLIPEKGYDSIDILRGISRLHDEYGLPEELYFENGTWNTKLINGTKGDRVPWEEFAYGLHGVGVRVRHAGVKNPRAKIVENVAGQLQNRMNRLRGYAGRRPDQCPEDTKRALQLVERGDAHPSEYFYSQEELLQELVRICNAFNHEPQNGKMLQGKSPCDAFVALRASPPVVLPENLRYLLARSRVEVTVKHTGIKVNRFTYKGEAASALIGQRVLAWFNAEDPETICVTDLDGKNPFTLRRETPIPAFDATPEEMAQAKRENHAQTKYPRTLYAKLQKDFPEEFLRARRHVLAPDSARELGVEMERQRAVTAAEAKQADRLQSKAAELSRRIGITANPRPASAERVEALSNLQRAGIQATSPYSYEESP